jgi:PAS domain S-box-containing protein
MDDAAAEDANFLIGGGEMGDRIRAHDWARTPVGPLAQWPQILKTLVGVLVGSNQPMFIVWGPQGTLFYNDAYAEILGDKHPDALGRDFLEVWHEIRADLTPIVERARSGMPVHMDDIELVMHRRGYPEETHFAFSYTPVRDETGAVSGFFCPCLEITEQVLSERRQAFRLALDERLRTLADPVEIASVAAEALGRHLRVARAGYGELDETGEVIRVERDWADGVASLAGEARLLPAFGEAIAAGLRAGETLRVDDRRGDPRASGPGVAETWDSIDLVAIIAVPLVKNGRFVAFLYLHEPRPRRWTDEEVKLAEQVAERVWGAVERARAEAALRETSRRLNAVLSNASVAIFLMDGDHRCVYMNPAAETLTGYTLADTHGRHLHDLIHHTRTDGSPYPAEDCPIDGVGSGIDGRRGEEVFVHRSGRFIPVAFAASAIRDEAGEPVGTILEVQDITERKAAEAALRESEARFRLMADATPQIVWVTDAQGRAEFFNRQWFDYTGADRGPISANEVSADYIHPDDGAATMAAFDEARRAGGTFQVEHRIRSREGKYRWFLARGEPYRDPATGEITRWFGASVDIHDRRLAEARLRTLNETLEAQVAARAAERDRLWSLSQDMLARADYTGMMSAVSPAWEQVLGWSETELLTRGYATFMHPEDEPPTLAAIGQMAETGQPTRFENRIATSDGGWKNIEWTVAPEPDGVNFIAVGRDVSLTRAREAELAAAQDALRQSQKLEAMGQLTGGVAHDFNNLLSPIIGSLDMLTRRGVGSERERRLIDGALQSAERAKTLVQRLLAFARRQPLQPVAIDLKRVVGEMAELVASTSGPNIDVRVDLPGGLPPVHADANQLEMAILNLAVNARDAMPDGGALTISAAPDTVRENRRGGPSRGHYVRLSVADTGTGMDEATLARAIEPFFSTKGIGKGTGLGLSMVHGLALQLNGALAIASKPGEGTRIDLWLPISATTDDVGETAREAALAPKAVGKALLVDDEELVRMSTADMLSDLGYEVVEAASAEEALALVADGLAPDILVSDHLMPGMSGEDLARELRARRPGLPVLIVSGYAEADGLDPSLPRLTKPFRISELAELLAAVAAP